MERGPYDRPPSEGPGYPGRGPGATPPGYEQPPERRFGLAEAGALLALIAAGVAIFLAIDARNAGNDDEEVAMQVREETQRQIEEIRSSLGQQAGSAGARARQAEEEATETREAVSRLRRQNADLQTEVDALRSRQNQIRASLKRQNEAIADIRATLREEGQGP